MAIYPIKKRSEVYETYQKFKAEYGTPRIIRTDGEYIKKIWRQELMKEGIKHEMTCPYTSEQNADLESSWRTLQQLTRANIKQSGLPKSFWNHAATYSAQQMNAWPISKPKNLSQQQSTSSNTPKTPPNAINSTNVKQNATRTYTTPFEIFHGAKPRVELLHPFGCTAYVHVMKEDRDDPKLSYRAKEGVFLGSSRKRKGFKIYIPSSNQTITSRNVTFLPEDFTCSLQVKREFSNVEQEYGDVEDYTPENEDEVSETDEFEISEKTNNADNLSSEYESDEEEIPTSTVSNTRNQDTRQNTDTTTVKTTETTTMLQESNVSNQTNTSDQIREPQNQAHHNYCPSSVTDSPNNPQQAITSSSSLPSGQNETQVTKFLEEEPSKSSQSRNPLQVETRRSTRRKITPREYWKTTKEQQGVRNASYTVAQNKNSTRNENTEPKIPPELKINFNQFEPETYHQAIYGNESNQWKEVEVKS